MSYGIWRRRGKGWCSIEIDTPGNDLTMCELERRDETAYKILKGCLRAEWIEFDEYYSDVHQLRREYNQTKKQPQRKIVSYCPGGGEHVRWIAYDDRYCLLEAMRRDEATQEEIEFVLKKTQ